ncbi:AraC family transcriptional regulator [Oryzifoliimicrobium ureilyticus]|uniref:AraC family transcriptional regulator n=1 Tax=Oryzifoliimicrobium ureilyticus TaxID=3113724 RepID=UPI0030763BF9
MLDHSSRPLPSSEIAIDALSEVLQDFRLSGVNYGRCELKHPWSIAFPEQQLLRFHFVSHGPCWIYTETQGWQELNDGDLVLLPQGNAHRLASAPDVVGDSLQSCQITKLGSNVCEVVRDGAGASSTLFCGSMSLGAHALNPLISLMPPIIKGCDVAGNDPVISPLLIAMAEEAAQPQMGSATVLSRMADLLAARLIRCWVNCSGASTTGWLAAIRDPNIGRALAAMHRDPSHNWTLESLAKVAGQSRSVFAERFSAVLGEGAAHYLTRLRMQLGRDLLVNNGLSVAEVASRLGYESEASFARAFKRITQVSPGVVRRTSSGRTAMEFGS